MIQPSRSVCLLALAAALAAPAGAQQYVYPAKGQTPEKQKSDESACYSWAVQQTGFDPAKAPPPAAAAPTTATGTTAGAGARGAAKGAVVGGDRGRRRYWRGGRRGGRAQPEPAPEHGADAAAGRCDAATAGQRSPRHAARAWRARVTPSNEAALRDEARHRARWSTLSVALAAA